MAFNANEAPKSTGGFTREVMEEGLYPARLARVVEVGDQEDKYGIKTKVVLAFTIPSQTIEIGGEQKQKMMMTFPLNQTSNPDATLMKYMKALGGATWPDVINKPCMIEISHKTVKGETRDNITNVVKPMNGVDVAEPDCDTYIFDFENPEREVFDKLSEFRQGQIKQAVNYRGSAVEEMLEGGSTAPSGSAEASIVEEDRPF